MQYVMFRDPRDPAVAHVMRIFEGEARIVAQVVQAKDSIDIDPVEAARMIAGAWSDPTTNAGASAPAPAPAGPGPAAPPAAPAGTTPQPPGPPTATAVGTRGDVFTFGTGAKAATP